MDKQFLILPHLKVNGANALNSLYSVGFPAMTAFLGFGHALERMVEHLKVISVGVVVHQADFQAVYDRRFHSWAIKAKKFPLIHARKPTYAGEVSSDSFQPRAYVHLDVSLILECGDIPREARQDVKENIGSTLSHLRLAGGTITNFQRPRFLFCDNDSDIFWKDRKARCNEALRAVMPGFALIQRNDILDDLAKEGKGDALDRIFYATSSTSTPVEVGKDTVRYQRERHIKGWLIPLAVGFHDLSGAMTVEKQRSYDAEHHFVEPLISLCEFRMPHRFQSIDEILWHYEYDSAQRNYLCVNNNHMEKE